MIAKDIASCLSMIGDDKLALRTWARNTSLEKWREDPIGKIKGVGLITFQYLRMMGGIDTVMPDKIVKRVINEILEKAGSKPISGDMEFVKKAEEIALTCGYRPVELCWMTWLVQPVVSYFEKKGLPVIAKRDSRNGDILRGKDEFGVSLEESEFLRPGVLAFDWRSDPLITTEAVECKLAISSGRSVVGALGQAASYQILFDHVYVAVQSGEIGYRESILSELGLGWISVDKSGNVDIRRFPEHRRRFDMDQFNEQVLPRLVLPPAFLEVFGRPIGYGETREGGIWVAKELARDPDTHLQVSSWFDRTEQTSFSYMLH